MKKIIVGVLVFGSIVSYANTDINETLIDTIVTQRDYSLVSSTEETVKVCPLKISFNEEDSGRISLSGVHHSNYSWLMEGLNLRTVNKGNIRSRKRDSRWQIISKSRLRIKSDKSSIELIEVDIAKDTVLDYMVNTFSGFIRPYAQRTFKNSKRHVKYTKTSSGFKVSGKIIDRVWGDDTDKRDLITCEYANL